MADIIVVTGTPGAGKTTVLMAAIAKIGQEKVKVINFADSMLKVGESLGLGGNHDAIRKLPTEQQRDLQKRAAGAIAAETFEKVIVDTHCTINTPEGYLPGMPEWVVKALNPRVIVLVEAPPEEISGRRQTDKSRVRDEEDIRYILLQQDINRAAAFAYAALSGATVKIIENRNNKLEDAADEFKELFERLK